MALFEVTENDRQVYRRDIENFLPDRIIDIHTHLWLDSLRRRPEGGNTRTVAWPSLVAAENTAEDLAETYRLLFPGKQVTPMVFASGERETLDSINEFVRKSAWSAGFPALYYSRPEQSAAELEKRILDGGFIGIKSYLDLSPAYLPEAEIRIFDFFPKHQLALMDSMKAIVMLHIPRNGRLRDPVNLAQILEIKREFPSIRLIIAHIGRAYVESDVGNAFDVLSESDTLLFDFCANTCEFAMRSLIQAVGPRRIMFGSDMPILRMRTRRIEENGTYINLIPPGLYGDPSQDKHLREVPADEADRITFFMYEEIMAFRRAAEKTGLTHGDIKRIFHDNAHDLIFGAYRDIYGREFPFDI